jgi:hypothetical protein
MVWGARLYAPPRPVIDRRGYRSAVYMNSTEEPKIMIPAATGRPAAAKSRNGFFFEGPE